MSATTVDLLALLADDPTFDENDEPLATQHHRDAWVRWVDPLTGEELPLLREELAQGRREADLRRTAQAEARIELERRLAAEATAREELQRRLAAEAGQRAAEGRAAAEAAARLVAEEEITRLRRALERRSEFDDAR